MDSNRYFKRFINSGKWFKYSISSISCEKLLSGSRSRKRSIDSGSGYLEHAMASSERRTRSIISSRYREWSICCSKGFNWNRRKELPKNSAHKSYYCVQPTKLSGSDCPVHMIPTFKSKELEYQPNLHLINQN